MAVTPYIDGLGGGDPYQHTGEQSIIFSPSPPWICPLHEYTISYNTCSDPCIVTIIDEDPEGSDLIVYSTKPQGGSYGAWYSAEGVTINIYAPYGHYGEWGGIKAKAQKDGEWSDVVEQLFSCIPQVKITIGGGSYTYEDAEIYAEPFIARNAGTSWVHMYYTTDGSDPTHDYGDSPNYDYGFGFAPSGTCNYEDNPQYVHFDWNPTLTGTEAPVVKFFGINYEYDSKLVSRTIYFRVPHVVFNHSSKSFYNSIYILLSRYENASEEYTDIYYTLNGEDPTFNSTLYSGSINLESTTVVKAIAYTSTYDMYSTEGVSSNTYTFEIAQVDFDPHYETIVSGTLVDYRNFYDYIYVALSCVSSGTNIYYTTNGEEPDTNSDLYSDQIYIDDDIIIKAVAYDVGRSMYSTEGSITGTYIYKQLPTPTFSGIYPGLYLKEKDTYFKPPIDYSITESTSPYEYILPPSGTSIYYTVNGGIPDENDIIYIDGEDIHFNEGTTILQAMTMASGCQNSDVVSGTWTIVLRDVIGDPYILDNQLFFDGWEYENMTPLKTKYVILGDFEVQVSGTGSFLITDEPGMDEYYCSLRLIRKNGSWYEVARRDFDGIEYFILNDSIGGISKQDQVSNVDEYMFKICRTYDDVTFLYTTSSGWVALDTITMDPYECYLELRIDSGGDDIVIADNFNFDNFEFSSGLASHYNPTYDSIETTKSMIIDNIKVDQSTVIDIYDITIEGDTLYRLQNEATYYGTDNDWGSMYNYQVSTIRPFIDSITVTAYPLILPANAKNVTQVTAAVFDQYGDGAENKPVFFIDNDDVGYVLVNPAYTDYFFGTGQAKTAYRAGVDSHTVNIEGTVTQYD